MYVTILLMFFQDEEMEHFQQIKSIQNNNIKGKKIAWASPKVKKKIETVSFAKKEDFEQEIIEQKTIDIVDLDFTGMSLRLK